MEWVVATMERQVATMERQVATLDTSPATREEKHDLAFADAVSVFEDPGLEVHVRVYDRGRGSMKLTRITVDPAEVLLQA